MDLATPTARPLLRWSLLVLGLALGLAAGGLVAFAGPVGGLLVIGIAGLGLAVRYFPGVVFAAYLLIPFYKGAAQAYVPVDLTTALAMVNALQAIALVLHPPSRRISQAALLLWLALTTLVIAGILYAPDQGLAVGRVVNWLLLVFVPIAIGALRVGSNARYVRQLLWSFFVMGIAVALVGLASLSSSERLAVLGANTISVGRGALLVPLLAPLIVFRSRSAPLQLVTVLLIPVAFVVAIGTGSRGPLLVIAVLATLGALRLVIHRPPLEPPLLRRLAALAVASAVILSLTVSQLPAESLQRFEGFGTFIESTLAGRSTGDRSSEVRVDLFDAAIQMFESQPLLGMGTAGYEAISHRFLGPEQDVYPHNSVLQFAAEYGLLGLALFLALVILALGRRLHDRDAASARIVFLFFLLSGLFSENVFEDRTMWGMMMLVLLFDPGTVGGPAGGAGVGPSSLWSRRRRSGVEEPLSGAADGPSEPLGLPAPAVAGEGGAASRPEPPPTAVRIAPQLVSITAS